MKPFENSMVGDKVYLPNDPKGYEIVYRKENYLQAEINGELYGFNDDGINPFNKTLGQIIYPYPVNIQDGREPSNCGNHECSMAKYCFGDNPLDYCECPDYWKPKEESCK